MSSWYQCAAPENDIAISTRVRLARNLTGIPFPRGMSGERRREMNEKIRTALDNCGTPLAKTLKFIYMKDIPESEIYSMVERHIISREFAACSAECAIILSDDESISIMIGEEDHLRIQVILDGLQLEKAYEIAEQLDTMLCEQLHFAFSERLGFLTACPTNLGTGLRASVMLHLPVLESGQDISALTSSVGKIGFTVRGLYGEGSKGTGSLYQISNQITLGISEKNAIDNLAVIAGQIAEKERQARGTLEYTRLADVSWRALGALQNCRILSSEEMMNLLSRIKLGQSMGILETKANPIKIMIEGQPFMLMRKFGQILPEERDINRANMVREAFI